LLIVKLADVIVPEESVRAPVKTAPLARLITPVVVILPTKEEDRMVIVLPEILKTAAAVASIVTFLDPVSIVLPDLEATTEFCPE
jgi:hypothetical protein